MHRRKFLRRAAAAGAVGSVVIGTVAAAEPPSRPDHLENVGDDLDQLRKYQPSVITNYDTRQKMVGCYGWYAESSKSECENLRATYFWIKYPTQKGLIPSYVPVVGGSDSHFKDHEPILIISNVDTGEVERVLASGGHHFVLDLPASNLELLSRETDDPTHPKMRVNVNHHHYRNGAGNERDGVLPSTISGVEFGSWLDKRGPWYDNEVFKKTSETAVEDPFTLIDEVDTWWKEGTRDAWFARNIWIPLGMREADESDTLRVER